MTESVPFLSLPQFTQLVNAAFKNYNSVLTLARSPLADSSLVAPLLVLDDVSPTANERGSALRLLLFWATNKLAPGQIPFPMGQERPLDDPTWRDPRWWRYNILRHRYIEPLHPDQFVEGGRFTETLVALTGIPSVDTFYDERNRAIREVAQWLHPQLERGHADGELQHLALEAAYLPLHSETTSRALLHIAATFDDVFPRYLLVQMAQQEQLSHVESGLNHLIAHRYLQTDHESESLWLSPVLRTYVYTRQSREKALNRHRKAAEYFAHHQEVLRAARHYISAQRWSQAAEILLTCAHELIHELELDELYEVLQLFENADLAGEPLRGINWLMCDLFIRSGRQNEALATCRRLLKLTDSVAEQARIYRRMGKLYEKHNQLHALGYYQQAVDRLKPDDSELVDLLKDRAWLYILRKEWRQAEQDLVLALERLPESAKESRADIHDALASLYGEQNLYDQALKFSHNALGLREELGDLSRVANSFINMGLIYSGMGNYSHAIAAYEEAMVAYKKMGNQELIATALLNIGTAYHLDNNIEAAISHYNESLQISSAIGFPLAEVRARYNLAEALADQNQCQDAQRHWQLAYRLSERSGFDDELTDLRNLKAETPALQAFAQTPQDANGARLEFTAPLEPEEEDLLKFVQERGRITTKLLMESTHVSKATANRRLAHLVDRGHLQKFGKGRSTYYALATSETNGAPASSPATTSRRSAAHTSWDQVLDKLKQLQSTLLLEYPIENLGVAEAATLDPSPMRLFVSFYAEPDLLRYFELEQQLITALQTEIDLILVNSARYAQIAGRVEGIHWMN